MAEWFVYVGERNLKRRMPAWTKSCCQVPKMNSKAGWNYPE